MLLSGAAGIAVAEMNDGGNMDAFEATVEGFGAVGENFFVVTRHGGLVDLQARRILPPASRAAPR